MQPAEFTLSRGEIRVPTQAGWNPDPDQQDQRELKVSAPRPSPLFALRPGLLSLLPHVVLVQFLDLRVAVLGNVDSGKSTLLGVLTQGELDNGRGRARLNLFRHLHEIQTGRTSSISFEILGFNSKGEVSTSASGGLIMTEV